MASLSYRTLSGQPEEVDKNMMDEDRMIQMREDDCVCVK